MEPEPGSSWTRVARTFPKAIFTGPDCGEEEPCVASWWMINGITGIRLQDWWRRTCVKQFCEPHRIAMILCPTFMNWW